MKTSVSMASEGAPFRLNCIWKQSFLKAHFVSFVSSLYQHCVDQTILLSKGEYLQGQKFDIFGQIS